MTFDDITVEELRASGSSKWRTFPRELGAFVAEMDFGTSPEILATIQQEIRQGIFGYSTDAQRDALSQATAEFFSTSYDWKVSAEHIFIVPEVLTALEMTLRHLVDTHEPVIVPTPAYMPFLTLPLSTGNPIMQVPSHYNRSISRWELDLVGIDQAFTQGAKLLILTNPANPTGTVLTREELTRVSLIVEKHGATVWSDEIHAPLTYPENTHIPYASISPQAANHSITATSASKGWNIPGLKCAQIILTNPQHRAAWRRVGQWSTHAAGYLGILASTTAYSVQSSWLPKVLEYLDKNRYFLAKTVPELLPKAHFDPPEATYLAWLDLRDYHLPNDNLTAYFRKKAGVVATDGRHCGEGFAGFLRVNFATPLPILRDVIRKLATAAGTL